MRSPDPLFPARYLLYDVNPPEGFNLRRDVYIRVASLLKTLLKTEEWVLVLPPWGRLYHWQSPDIHQVRIPWADFFDLPSLNRNIPVIEYEQFIAGEAVSHLGPEGLASGGPAGAPLRSPRRQCSRSFRGFSGDIVPTCASFVSLASESPGCLVTCAGEAPAPPAGLVPEDRGAPTLCCGEHGAWVMLTTSGNA